MCLFISNINAFKLIIFLVAECS